MIDIIDNALPDWLFQEVEHVSKNKIPLFAGPTATDKDPYWSFGVPVEYEDRGGETLFLSWLAFAKYYNAKELIRARIGLIPRDIKYTITGPHIDNKNPHTVGLLYLDDCDGETYIYKNRFDWDFDWKKNIPEEELNQMSKTESGCILYAEHKGWSFDKNPDGNYKDFEIEEKVMPKKNRLVVFDGSHFHASSTPTTQQMRWAINYNFR